MAQDENQSIPRHRILLQDGVTGIQLAAGTDDINKFTKTDLMKFVRQYKQNIELVENPIEIAPDSPEEDKKLKGDSL